MVTTTGAIIVLSNHVSMKSVVVPNVPNVRIEELSCLMEVRMKLRDVFGVPLEETETLDIPIRSKLMPPYGPILKWRQ
jgi:hypothetical protein